MSGVSSIVHNYRKLKNQTRVKISKVSDLHLIKNNSIHKFQTKFLKENFDNIIKESKKHNSKFVMIYRKNLFEKALAWYDHHVNNEILDVIFINSWIEDVKIKETEVYNMYKDVVDVELITYEDLYVNNYNTMIEKLKIFDLDIDIDTAKLVRYTNNKQKTLNGKYNWKPEIDIHKDKPGFDICYNLLSDERIEYT